MKIIVKNKNNNYYGQELDILKMNYENVLAYDKIKGTRIIFKKKDIRFKGDNEYEKAIEKCSDLLKIKLTSKMSFALYNALYEAINSSIGHKAKNIDVIKDSNRKIKKDLWEKTLLLAVNREFYLEVSIVGHNFSQSFDIYIKTVDNNDFVEKCSLEMQKLINEKEIASKKIKAFKKYIS